MRNRHYLWMLALAGVIPWTSAFAQKYESTAPKTITTKQKSFTIPVAVDRTQANHVPVEVQLLVSGDQGKTWSMYARQSPEAKGFVFQTRDDGEYWFASRTLDAQGRAKPAGEIAPELKIAIDATPPQIALDAAANGTGEIKAAWRVTDDFVNPAELRLEYQAGDATIPAWQAVTLDPQQLKQTGNMLTGEAKWSPNTSCRVVDIRLLATDQAGNVHTEIQRVFLPRVAQKTTAPAWPPRPQVAATPTSPSAIGQDPFAARLPETKTQPVTSSPRVGETWPSNNELNPPAKLPSVDSLAQQPLPTAISPVAPPVSADVPAISPSHKQRPIAWPVGEHQANPSPAPNAALVTPPDELLPRGQANEARTPIATPVDTGLPSHVKPLLSNRKSFALDYDLDSVGPAGVKAVELWVTHDNGASWRKWGEDADKRSPFEIEVESERVFGFRMVIVSNNGLATKPPEPGDAADVWVQIDSSKPSVRLDQAGYGHGEHAGQLDIRWQADDEHLGERPVTLVFGEQPEGPWTTLAAGLPNTGQHYWTIDPRTPRQLYLRIEVRDEAGNLQFDQTAEPISLEGLAPRGRIRSINGPAANTGQKPKFSSPLFR